MNYLKKKRKNIVLNSLMIIVLGFILMSTLDISGKTENDLEKNSCKRNLCYDYERILSRNLNVDNIETEAKKVMIVAHPDDETLWGSHELYKEKYLVVCVTCGGRLDRVKEFERVMELTADDYIMLNYPDLVKGKKSTWEKEWDSIDADLKNIVEAKDWDLIVTHNPDGEYGHIHHKMTNQMVTQHANHDKLSYFGKFYWGKIPNKDKLYELTADEFSFKTNVLIPEYKTQEKAIYNLRNMVHYESWITFDEWFGDIDE